MKHFTGQQGSHAEIKNMAAHFLFPSICGIKDWDEKRVLLLREWFRFKDCCSRQNTKVLIKLCKSNEKPSCSGIWEVKHLKLSLVWDVHKSPCCCSRVTHWHFLLLGEGFWALEFPESDRNQPCGSPREKLSYLGFSSTYSWGFTLRTSLALERKSIKHL